MNFKNMSKSALIKYANDKGIEINPKCTRNEIAKTVRKHEQDQREYNKPYNKEMRIRSKLRNDPDYDIADVFKEMTGLELR